MFFKGLFLAFFGFIIIGQIKTDRKRSGIDNMGSLEMRASIYISAKLKNLPIHTNRCSFQLKGTLEAINF